MSIPISEKRLSRSQARAGTPAEGSKTPTHTMTPSSAMKSDRGSSKTGRRVLAELACNDSPVVGLLPAGTPSSCKKSTSGALLRSRRVLLASTPSHPALTTPIGESLLRSQVQLLLQKVEESGVCSHLNEASCLRTCEHPNAGGRIVASSAPTPLNTPAVLATTMHEPILDSQGIIESDSLNNSMDATSQDVFDFFEGAQVHQQVSDLAPLSLNGSPCTEIWSSSTEPQVQNVASSAIDTFTASLSTTSRVDEQPLQLTPLVSEISDVPSSAEIFLGERTLYFDDDSPCKSPPAKLSGMVIFADPGYPRVRELDDEEVSKWSVHENVGSPADKAVADLAVACTNVVECGENHSLPLRERDEDEISEWSVHVNVGSPADKQTIVDLAARTNMDERGDNSSIHDHVKKMQQVSSSKVDLLWDKGRERKATPYRTEGVLGIEDKADTEEEDSDYSEEYYSGREEEDGGECDNLCDMFREMRFEQESKGLPRGEGKHIRFLYEDREDEISEAMVVRGEEEVFRGGVGIRLKGLPVSLGRHWRFAQEEDEDEEEHGNY